MATKPECPYCGRTTGLRQVHEGCGSIPAEYTCEGCFTATDTGPCFDDLPLAPVTMTPREAGEAAFYECEGNNAACLKAAFDAYEAADIMRDPVVAGANGGPAFSALATSPMGDVHHQEGMSLRDWFAGQALAGIASLLDDSDGGMIGDLANGVRGGRPLAAAAYQLADAMLAARSKAKEA